MFISNTLFAVAAPVPGALLGVLDTTFTGVDNTLGTGFAGVVNTVGTVGVVVETTVSDYTCTNPTVHTVLTRSHRKV